tara:strand:- start:418 stop:1161 length:744 start_codon:yes stop_codon:yes gene_type:complete
VIIFLRIPKAASTYIVRELSIFKKRNRPEMKMSQSYIQGVFDNKNPKISLGGNFDGHYSYGIHRILDTSIKEIKYITFLRDPISRWVSAFNYNIGRSDKVKNNCMKECFFKNSNIEDFLDECIERGHSFNTMTRQLSGMERMDNITTGYYTPHESIRNMYTDLDLEDMLLSAMNNIKNKFFYVGRVESIIPNLKALKKKLKITSPLNKKKANKTKMSVSIDIGDPNVYGKIVELNKYDIRLYSELNV